MTSMNTGSQELKYNNKTSLPPLVQYKDIRNYTPAYGDFVIWSGLMTTWCGVVSNYNKESKSLSIIFSGVPFVLFTLMPSEQAKETKEMKLEDILRKKVDLVEYSAIKSLIKNSILNEEIRII